MVINIYRDKEKIFSWQSDGADEYIRRIGRYSDVSVLKRETPGPDSYSFHDIVFSDDGKDISSEELSEIIGKLMMTRSEINIFSSSESYYEYGQNRSFESAGMPLNIKLISPSLSLDTSLVLLLEQIYRAFKIMNGENYHK